MHSGKRLIEVVEKLPPRLILGRFAKTLCMIFEGTPPDKKKILMPHLHAPLQLM